MEIRKEVRSMSEVKCKKCGCEIDEGREYCAKCDKRRNRNFFKNKKFLIIIALVVLVIIASIIIVTTNNKIERERKAAEQEKYNKLPVKVDISMTSYYGTIEYILYELDLDFDLVTMGANCYSGVQRNEFKTKKYGILHTEFRYCKSNRTMVFRVYNDTKDQKLREPKSGELAQFDEDGEKIKGNSEKDL